MNQSVKEWAQFHGLEYLFDSHAPLVLYLYSRAEREVVMHERMEQLFAKSVESLSRVAERLDFNVP